MKLITLNLAIVEMVITRGGICYCVFFFFFFLHYENRALVEIQRERKREREQLADWRLEEHALHNSAWLSKAWESFLLLSRIVFPSGVRCFRFALTGLKLLNWRGSGGQNTGVKYSIPHELFTSNVYILVQQPSNNRFLSSNVWINWQKDLKKRKKYHPLEQKKKKKNFRTKLCETNKIFLSIIIVISSRYIFEN